METVLAGLPTMTSNMFPPSPLGPPLANVVTWVFVATSIMPSVDGLLNWFVTQAVWPPWANATAVGMKPTATDPVNANPDERSTRARRDASSCVIYATSFDEMASPYGRPASGADNWITPAG